MAQRHLNGEESEPLHGTFPGDGNHGLHASGGHIARCFGENGEATQVVADHSGEEFLHSFCAKFGVDFNTAIEMQAELEEHLLIRRDRTSQHDVDRLKKTFGRMWLSELQIIFSELIKCQNGNLAIRAMAFARGLHEVIGYKTPADIGRQYDCSRYNVTKLVQKFQEALGLEKQRGQKTEEACNKMAASRRRQLVGAAAQQPKNK